MISKFPKDLGFKIAQKFENFDKQLKTKTNNPEEVDALKQAMVTMPMKINELRGEIESTEVHTCLFKLSIYVVYILKLF
jgi:dynein heavy chain